MQVYSMFNEELNNVKKELSSKVTNMLPHLPKYAGSAHWARALKRRIDRPMEVKTRHLFFFSFTNIKGLEKF